MSNYECCKCKEVSSAEEINQITLDECCNNRADRRRYVPIDKTKQTDRKWYRCPKCGTNIRRMGWKKVDE